MSSAMPGTPHWPLTARDEQWNPLQKLRDAAPAIVRASAAIPLFIAIAAAYYALTRLQLPFVAKMSVHTWLASLADWLLTGGAFSAGSPLACGVLAVWFARYTSFAQRIATDRVTFAEIGFACIPCSFAVAAVTAVWLATGRVHATPLSLLETVASLLGGCLVIVIAYALLDSKFGVNIIGLHCMIGLFTVAVRSSAATFFIPLAIAAVIIAIAMSGAARIRFTERTTGFNEEADAIVPNDDVVIQYAVLLVMGIFTTVADSMAKAFFPTVVPWRASSIAGACAIAAVLMWWYSERFGFPSGVRPDFTARFLQASGWIAHGIRPGAETAALIRSRVGKVARRWIVTFQLVVTTFVCAVLWNPANAPRFNAFVLTVLVSGSAMLLVRACLRTWQTVVSGPRVPQIIIEQDASETGDQLLRAMIETFPTDVREEALRYLDRHEWRALPSMFAVVTGEEYQVHKQLEEKGVLRVAWDNLWEAFVPTAALMFILFVVMSQTQPKMDWIGTFFLTILPSVWFAGYAKRLIIISKWMLKRRRMRNGRG